MRTLIREYGERESWKVHHSAVSLHSHTHHSREIMADLPRYIARIPLVAVAFEREVGRYREREGRELDFSRGWWHPPVSPRAAFESETQQIEQRLQLHALVSVTDHDDIRAGIELQELYANRRAPVSFEWTVPYGRGFLHVGVNNLPVREVAEWFSRLNAYTRGISCDSLTALLTDLNRVPDVLLVLCHPLWDLARVGAEEHTRQLRRFLGVHRRQINPVENKGYRPWEGKTRGPARGGLG